jgi:small subunit ribosomal protein S6
LFNEYEIVIIVRPDLDDPSAIAALDKVCETVTELGGHILDKEDWGSRKLAYLIQKHARGHYFMAVVLVPPSKLFEIERRMRLDDRLMRFLTVCTGEAVEAETRIAAAEERRAAQPGLRRRFDLEEEEPAEDDYDADGAGVD